MPAVVLNTVRESVGDLPASIGIENRLTEYLFSDGRTIRLRMTSLHSLQNRIRPWALLGILAFVGAATYFEFVYSGPPTPYAIFLWIIVVPLLLAAAVNGVRRHPLYQPLLYGSFVAIGTLQYLDGDWFLLAGLFVLGGVIGLILEFRDRSDSGVTLSQ